LLIFAIMHGTCAAMTLRNTQISYRDAPEIPAFSDEGPVCVMDANCALCARGAMWIAHNDHQGAFRIIPLQSDLGAALMRHYGLDPEDPNSWLFLEDGCAYSSLEALARVGRRLGGIWRSLSVVLILPRPVRNVLYRFVARNRYRWFGTANLCFVPDPEVQKRLIK
jgi:predicted DCC family thiol-disulfide oxidoreductase YuxK